MPTGNRMTEKWADPEYRILRARNCYKPFLQEEIISEMMIVFLDKQEQIDGDHTKVGMLRIWVECPDCHQQRWVRVNDLRRSKRDHTRCKKCAALSRAKRQPRKMKKGVYISGGYRQVHRDILNPEIRKIAVEYFGNYTYFYEHRLVALLKFGAEAMGPNGGKQSKTKIVVRHLDGNKLNNDPSNLAIGTQRQNINDHLTDRRIVKLDQVIMRYLWETLINSEVLSTNDEEQDPAYFGVAV